MLRTRRNRQFVTAVAGTALPAELDDGLMFNLDAVTAEAIRDEEAHGNRFMSMSRSVTRSGRIELLDQSAGGVWPVTSMHVS
jgi:hypothetical protein